MKKIILDIFFSLIEGEVIIFVLKTGLELKDGMFLFVLF